MLTADPKAYGSSFFAATQADRPERAKLNFDLDIDVCIIGAGLAGLTAAREIAKRGWSVAVLEARNVAWNASGRNAGVVRPGYTAPPEKLVERVGVAHAKALWALSEAGVEYVRASTKDPAMTGIALAEDGWLHVSKTDERRPLEARVELLAGQFGAKVERWPAEWVRQVINSAVYFDAAHYPAAFSVHPLNYALGLAASAEAAGARIFEDTPVTAIDPAGVRKRINTRDARVRASHVVLAGSIHIAGLMPQYASTLLPGYSAAITTALIGDNLQRAIRVPLTVSDTRLADGYYRVVDGSRLMWTGRSSVWRGRPKAYGNALAAEIRRTFPQLGKVKVDHAWTGVVGHTVHGMPLIGEASPGVWLLSGFGDHGLNTTAIGGLMVARAIAENDQTWQLFNPFALVWAGGLAGRAAQQVFYWSERARDRVGSALAQRRDYKRRLAAEAAVASKVKLPRLRLRADVPSVFRRKSKAAEPAETSSRGETP